MFRKRLIVKNMSLNIFQSKRKSIFFKRLSRFLILLLLLFTFRTILFNTFFTYQIVDYRNIKIPPNKALKAYIDANDDSNANDLNSIVDTSVKITSELLSFTFRQSTKNPNKLYEINKANCIGYAVLLETVLSYLIKKYNCSNELEVLHCVAEIHCLGINVHDYIEHSFFKDHDFNVIEFKQTNAQIAIDPSLYDYLWINSVSIRK